MTVRCPSIPNSEKVASIEATQCEDAYSSRLVFIPRITITQTRLIFRIIVIECNGKRPSCRTFLLSLNILFLFLDWELFSIKEFCNRGAYHISFEKSSQFFVNASENFTTFS